MSPLARSIYKHLLVRLRRKRVSITYAELARANDMHPRSPRLHAALGEGRTRAVTRSCRACPRSCGAPAHTSRVPATTRWLIHARTPTNSGSAPGNASTRAWSASSTAFRRSWRETDERRVRAWCAGSTASDEAKSAGYVKLAIRVRGPTKHCVSASGRQPLLATHASYGLQLP